MLKLDGYDVQGRKLNVAVSKPPSSSSSGSKSSGSEMRGAPTTVRQSYLSDINQPSVSLG